MKKTLLSALALCSMMLSTYAQDFSNGDKGFVIDYASETDTPNCLGGAGENGGIAIPNNGGYYGVGGNIGTNGGVKDVNGDVVLTFTASSGTLDGSVGPAFYDIYSQSTGACNPMRGDNIGIDLSTDPKISITAKSDVAGAKLRIWVGTYGTTTYSTYNTGAGSSIIWDIVLTTSYATYSFDFTANAADKEVWDAWLPANNKGDKTKINMLGVTAVTGSANYYIKEVALGSSVVTSTTAAVLPSTVKFGPNPSDSYINVNGIEVSNLKVLDMNGSVIRTSNSSSVEVAGLTSGLYFLQVNNFKPVKVMVK